MCECARARARRETSPKCVRELRRSRANGGRRRASHSDRALAVARVESSGRAKSLKKSTAAILAARSTHRHRRLAAVDCRLSARAPIECLRRRCGRQAAADMRFARACTRRRRVCCRRAAGLLIVSANVAWRFIVGHSTSSSIFTCAFSHFHLVAAAANSSNASAVLLTAAHLKLLEEVFFCVHKLFASRVLRSTFSDACKRSGEQNFERCRVDDNDGGGGGARARARVAHCFSFGAAHARLR